MAGLTDWLGPLIGMGGSIFGANQQGHTADQYSQVGAPFRTRLNAISENPNLYYDSPEASALANASDRRYSSVVGNPAGSGTARASALEAMLRGYGAERDRLFNYGGGAYLNRAAPGARGNQVGAQMGMWNALGPLAKMLPSFGSGGFGGAGGSSGGPEVGDNLGDYWT